MRVIGITGGVGAGKSTVLQYLESVLGAYVIQADLLQLNEQPKKCQNGLQQAL